VIVSYRLQRNLASCAILGAISLPASAEWESHLLPRDFDMASTMEKALVLAKQKDKAVIVYYTRTNCPPCNVLQSRLRQEAVAAPYRASYVFTAVWGSSMGHAERESYRKRFDVQGAPTLLVFNNAGQYVCTARGGFFTTDEATKVHAAAQTYLAMPRSADQGPRRCVAPT
jgi:thioredoxin-related protein